MLATQHYQFTPSVSGFKPQQKMAGQPQQRQQAMQQMQMPVMPMPTAP